ncbi:acyl-homoserine-lactone synthase [Phenylobacterium sp.]|uniref:acyl-homoserine-lactone synthase n=1 Tax=Phenylobacterium sp. TaxID=1871053 RepID=UPI001800EFF7|nr:acyl-homoserine-lactone synthase [Phenylobacterium sp.]MBA4792341.1 N-acyl-L-homoserine lactone synthetase [Phenylobacterium sp.]
MIHVITAQNRHLYAEQLADMFQFRRVHFVEENGWADLQSDETGERDAFDDEHAVYLLGLDPQDRIEVGLRVRPTTEGCILADAYPHMVAPGAPAVKGPDAWEMSRIFSTHAYRRARRGGRRVAETFLAAMETAHAAGAARLVGMVDMKLYPLASNIAWDLRLTGLPAPYPYGVMVGVYASAGAEEIAHLRESLGLAGPAGYEVEAQDLAACGSFQGVEAMFGRAVRPRPAELEPESPAAIAAAVATYAYHDGRRPERERAEDVRWAAE